MNDSKKIQTLLIVFNHWENECIKIYHLLYLMKCIKLSIGLKQENNLLSIDIYNFIFNQKWYELLSYDDMFYNYSINKKKDLILNLIDLLLKDIGGGIIRDKPIKTFLFSMSQRLHISFNYLQYLQLTEKQLRTIDALLLV